jgi:hypothetical protein
MLKVPYICACRLAAGPQDRRSGCKQLLLASQVHQRWTSRWQGTGACLRVVRDEKGEGLRLQQDVLYGGLRK